MIRGVSRPGAGACNQHLVCFRAHKLCEGRAGRETYVEFCAKGALWQVLPARNMKVDGWLDKAGPWHRHCTAGALGHCHCTLLPSSISPAASLSSAATSQPAQGRAGRDLHREKSIRVVRQVWPGPVHVPDFSGPRGQEYWQILNQEWFDSGARFHGLWIDMNEPSNFVQGAACGSSSSLRLCRTWNGLAEPHPELCVQKKHGRGHLGDLREQGLPVRPYPKRAALSRCAGSRSYMLLQGCKQGPQLCSDFRPRLGAIIETRCGCRLTRLLHPARIQHHCHLQKQWGPKMAHASPALRCKLLGTRAGTESVNQSKWDMPPYAINAGNVRQGLAAKTAAMTAYYNNDPFDIHYNRHNLYGLEESMATHRVVANITEERPFILTRWAACVTLNSSRIWGACPS